MRFTSQPYFLKNNSNALFSFQNFPSIYGNQWKILKKKSILRQDFLENTADSSKRASRVFNSVD